MDLNTARQKESGGEITYERLSVIFFEKATKEEIEEYWAAPVYDRPWIIQGLTKEERDNKFKQVYGKSFCECSFVMIRRDQKTQKAYCFECKKEVQE